MKTREKKKFGTNPRADNKPRRRWWPSGGLITTELLAHRNRPPGRNPCPIPMVVYFFANDDNGLLAYISEKMPARPLLDSVFALLVQDTQAITCFVLRREHSSFSHCPLQDPQKQQRNRGHYRDVFMLRSHTTGPFIRYLDHWLTAVLNRNSKGFGCTAQREWKFSHCLGTKNQAYNSKVTCMANLGGK